MKAEIVETTFLFLNFWSVRWRFWVPGNEKNLSFLFLGYPKITDHRFFLGNWKQNEKKQDFCFYYYLKYDKGLFMTSMLNITPSPSQSNLNLTLYQSRYPSILGKKNVSFWNNRKRKETTFYHCRLLLETETEPGTKSRFHYLCIKGSVRITTTIPTTTINIASANTPTTTTISNNYFNINNRNQRRISQHHNNNNQQQPLQLPVSTKFISVE